MQVRSKLPVGVVGEIADSSLKRALTKTVSSGASVEVGTALTATGDFVENGTGDFAGVATSPKQFSKNGLATTMTIPANGVVEALTFGRVWVKVVTAVTAGASGAFATGASGIATGAFGAAGTNYKTIPNSKYLTSVTGGELASTGNAMALLELS